MQIQRRLMYAFVVTGNLVNIRKSPNGTIIDRVRKGDILAYAGDVVGDWRRVWVKGVAGYIFKKYISVQYMRGEDVKTLQTRLNSLGYKSGAADGVFGQKTYQAVIEYQSAERLSVDGIVDSQTWAMLMSSDNPAGGDGSNNDVFMKIRVASFNIKRENAGLREFLEPLECDVVGIQESVNKLDTITTARMPYIQFARTITKEVYGIGILSKFPMTAQDVEEIPSNGHEQRVYQHTSVNETISIYNTHFSFENDGARLEQFASLKAAMDADMNPYKILLGDFNAPKDAEFDALQGYTVVHDGKIDKIIVSPNIKLSNYRFVAVPRTYSDHDIVIADLELQKE